MKSSKNINILNKINNKPIIIEKIFAFSLNRPLILYYLVSEDNHLKNKLNNLFSDVKKDKNDLGEEFCQNLTTYSYYKDIINILSDLLKEKNNKTLTYAYIKNELNYSFINNLNTSLLKLRRIKEIKKYIKDDILLKIFIEYYTTLENFTLVYLPSPYMESDYFKLIEDINKNSNEKNKMKQKIKLLLIFDENCFYNSKKYKLLNYPNIYEIEIFFGNKFIYYDNLLEKLNIYLSKIKYLENINKIIFHNLSYDNYLNLYNSNKIINKDIYQSLLGFFADDYYSKQKENYTYINLLRNNIKELFLEDIDFLYIYEKFKLYYFMDDFFNCLNKEKIDLGINNSIPYYANDKMLIIKNSINKKISDILSLIEHMIKANPKIQYLLLVNNIALTKEKIEKKLEINLKNLREFAFISSSCINGNELIDNIVLTEKENDIFIYEGYDNDNNLILYRKGMTIIQSFDLIELFKNNKILTKINLIKENVVINYNTERTKLEIINNYPIKTELDDIINKNIKLGHFEQFIYYQNNLKEITIKYFDYQLKNLENKNINILNINYEKNTSIFKYKNIKDDIIDPQNELIKLFPSLTTLSLGGDCQWLQEIPFNKISPKLSLIKLITDKKNKKLSKLKQKFIKKGKDIIIEYLDTNNEDIEEDEDDNMEEEAEYDEHDYPVTGIKGYGYSGLSLHVIKHSLRKDNLFNIENPNIQEEQFIKDFNKEHFKNIHLIDYSKILKNFQKSEKINNFIEKLSFEYDNTIKLMYRASEDKELSFEKLINTYINTEKSSLLIKTSLDIYFTLS